MWLAFIIGLVIGGALGVLLMGMLVMAGDERIAASKKRTWEDN